MVYYPYMPSIAGKRRGKQTYYYLVESARVSGRPRIVSQQYLGTAEEVMARLTAGDTATPERTQHRGFGDVAAVWSMLQRLDVAGIIDAVVGGRRADAAASVGTYVALAALNRVVAPCSKLAFADWWASTAGPRLTKVPVTACDHRRFWDAMDAIDLEQLVQIERAIDARMVQLVDLDLSGLVLDMTNFATFIDTGNARAPIAQRGKAKQKRTDLRLVGLGLVVSRDGGVPLVSHAYPGDRPDVTQFSQIIDELVARYREVAGGVQTLTVVFDAGNDSADNLDHLAAHQLHHVGSLVVSQHPDLLAIPARRFTLVDPERFGGLTAVETTTEALGQTRRVIVTHSPSFHNRQARGFAQTLGKARRQLAELQARLARGRTRRSRDAVQAEIDRITRPRWVNRVLTVTLTGHKPSQLRLSWRTDQAAHRRLANEIFGKRILFTDRTDWPVAEVVAAYRSQADAQAGFRQLKDPHVVSFSPMFHWTDQKIRIHLFSCVLALTLAHLMRREAARAGLSMSVREGLATLAGIQETVLLYPGERGRPRARRMLTDLDPTQRRLYQLFDLDRYAPRR
jgi:transposase